MLIEPGWWAAQKAHLLEGGPLFSFATFGRDGETVERLSAALIADMRCFGGHAHIPEDALDCAIWTMETKTDILIIEDDQFTSDLIAPHCAMPGIAS